MTPKEQILQAVQKGKISGSWLISGPVGSGKREFAASLASFLTNGVWKDEKVYNKNVKWIECGLTDDAKKEIQKMILAGKAVEENEKTTARRREITVDDIREGMQFLSLKAPENEYRILIIDLADDMNKNAANALLKMLEEPYERSILLLLSENTGKLLPTICSRCRKITLPLLGYNEMLQKLKELYPTCNYVDLLADLSGGSLGLAKKIYESNAVGIYQKITEFSASIAELDMEKVNDFAESISKESELFALFTTFWQAHLSALIKKNLSVNKNKTENLLDLFEESQKLFRQADTIYLDKKQLIINLILLLTEEVGDD